VDVGVRTVRSSLKELKSALLAKRIDGIRHGRCHTNLDLQELWLDLCSASLHIH